MPPPMIIEDFEEYLKKNPPKPPSVDLCNMLHKKILRGRKPDERDRFGDDLYQLV